MIPYYVLGIDPGPRDSGWMLILVEQDSPRELRILHVRSGQVGSTRNNFALLISLCDSADSGKRLYVAIERPIWQDHGHDPKATRAVAANLIETSRIASRVAELAWDALGHPVIELPAQTWRNGLLGQRGAPDALIKQAIERLVHGLPKRTNTHERDAGGVAVAAARLIANGREREYEDKF